MKVTSKLTAGALIPAILVMLSGWGIYGYRTRLAAMDEAAESLDQCLRLTRDQLHESLFGVWSDLTVLGTQSAFAEFEMFSRVGLLNDAEQQRLRIEEAAVNLVQARKTYDVFDFHDADGQGVVRVEQGAAVLRYQDAAQAPWFVEALEQGRSAYSFEGDSLRIASRVSLGHGIDGVVSVVCEANRLWGEELGFATRSGLRRGIRLLDRRTGFSLEQGWLVSKDENAIDVDVAVDLTSGIIAFMRQPGEAAIAQHLSAERGFTTALLALAGLMLLMVLYMVRILVLKPLEGIHKKAVAFQRQEQLPESVLTRKDELGDLDRALTGAVSGLVQAMDSLQSLNDGLEEKVRERTSALGRSEGKTRAIVEMAADGIITINATGAIESFNAAAEQMFGYATSEVLGHNVSLLMPSPEREQHDGYIQRYIGTGVKRVVGTRRETVGRRKDGTTFPIELGVTDMRLGSEQLFAGVLRDISSRKEAEKKLVSRARQQAAVARLGHEALSGEALDELMERTVALVSETLDVPCCAVLKSLPGQDKLLLRAGIGWRDGLVGQATVDSRDDSQIGYTLRTHEPVSVEDIRSEERFASHSLLGEHGLLSGMTVIIPGRKGPLGVLGAHLRECRTFSTDDVNFLVGIANVLAAAIQRKVVLDDLREAQVSAEEGTRAKSEFLANMSHEIRTPMNGILGMSELMMGTEMTAEQREYAGTVLDCSNSLLELINDILDISKIEAGKLELEHIDFDLGACVESALSVLAHRAADKDLELVCDIGRDVPSWVRGDPVRLRQVLINLGGNAIKFTELGEVEVGVTLEGRSADEATLLFSVRDTGIGIAPDRQEMVFGSFTQADGATTREYGGTGLGLSISRQLIGLMGGNIWVESEPGEGSTFRFRVALGHSASSRQSRAADELASTLTRAMQGQHVLVVDDNATNRRILQEQLSGWGCTVDSAQSGTDALERLGAAQARGEPFALLMLDVQMPEMDGFEVAWTVGRDPSYGQPDVVLLSPMGVGGEASADTRPASAASLTKPLRQSALMETLRTLYAADSQNETASDPASVASPAQRGSRVLIAEDNPVNAMLATRILEKAGCHVTPAANGSLALEILEHESFDLVFMDVQMPVMDGLEATRRIREREQQTGRRVPIVAMTAHAMKGDRLRCEAAGMDDYLTKPIRGEEVIGMVDQWVALADNEPSSPSPAETLPGSPRTGPSD